MATIAAIIGRICIALLFILAGLNKVMDPTATAEYITSQTALPGSLAIRATIGESHGERDAGRREEEVVPLHRHFAIQVERESVRAACRLVQSDLPIGRCRRCSRCRTSRKAGACEEQCPRECPCLYSGHHCAPSSKELPM